MSPAFRRAVKVILATALLAGAVQGSEELLADDSCQGDSLVLLQRGRGKLLTVHADQADDISGQNMTLENMTMNLVQAVAAYQDLDISGQNRSLAACDCDDLSSCEKCGGFGCPKPGKSEGIRLIPEDENSLYLKKLPLWKGLHVTWLQCTDPEKAMSRCGSKSTGLSMEFEGQKFKKGGCAKYLLTKGPGKPPKCWKKYGCKVKKGNMGLHATVLKSQKIPLKKLNSLTWKAQRYWVDKDGTVQTE